MRMSSLQTVSRPVLSILLASFLIACQSTPSRLYVLNSAATPSPDATAGLGSSGVPGRGQGRPPGSVPLLGVAVTLPQYLDSTNIVQRVGANELKPNYDAQWGESLSVDATRVVAEDLGARLTSFDVVMLPSRSHRTLDYEVAVDLSRFESDLAGNAAARGRWTITDAAGHEVASARVWREERASGTGYDATAAAMSRNLMALSADIAGALEAFSRRDGNAREATPENRPGKVDKPR